MRLLLDTHSFLWFIGGDKRLGNRAKAAIADIENEIYLSVASLWEIAVKINIGKLRLPRPFDVIVPDQLVRNDIQVLRADLRHFQAYIGLPLHHRDPFDRLLIAQSMTENLTIVSKDTAFGMYPVPVLW